MKSKLELKEKGACAVNFVYSTVGATTTLSAIGLAGVKAVSGDFNEQAVAITVAVAGGIGVLAGISSTLLVADGFRYKKQNTPTNDA